MTKLLEVPVTAYGQLMLETLYAARITQDDRRELSARWWDVPEEEVETA